MLKHIKANVLPLLGNQLLGPFVIVLRVTVEAAVLVAIVTSYLVKTGRAYLVRHVLIGISLSIAASISLGYVIYFAYGMFPEKELFEGFSALVAVSVITSVIVWMARKGKNLSREIERKVSGITQGLAIMSVVFVLVFREGVETVVF